MSGDNFGSGVGLGGIIGLVLALCVFTWMQSCDDADRITCRRALVAAHTASDTLAVLRGSKAPTCLSVANELKEKP